MRYSGFLRAAFAAVACAVLGSTATAADEAKLRVATTPIDVGAEVYYAQEMGFFKKAGLDVEVQTISNGGAITSAVVGGAIDIGQGNVLSLITAYKKNVPVTIIAPAGRYSSTRPTSQLVAKKDSPIRKASDLDNKTIAVNGLRNILELGTYAWAEKNGANAKNFRFIEMPFPQMGVSVEQGRVDAAFIAEPSLTDAKHDDLRVVGDPYTAIAPNFLIGGWFTTSAWAKAHPDLAKRFADVMRETADWANKNPEKSAAILAKYTKIPAATLKSMARSTYSDALSPGEIQPVIDAAAKYNFIDGGFSASQIINH